MFMTMYRSAENITVYSSKIQHVYISLEKYLFYTFLTTIYLFGRSGHSCLYSTFENIAPFVCIS